MKRILLLACLIGLPAKGANASCSVSATSINFGNYTSSTSTPGGTPITVTCPSGTSYTVGLSAGLGTGATTSVREMTGSSGGLLSYQLFQNASLTLNWGNTPGSDTVAGTGTGSAQVIDVYPQAPGGQNVTPGSYTDTITVTVTYVGGSATTTLGVASTVLAACQISGASINFGNYSGSLLAPGGIPISISCTNTTSYDVALDAGQGSGATVISREMTGPGSATLTYQVFQDAGHTVNWGDSPDADVHGTGTGAAQTIYMYPQLPAGQNVTPGTYTDTIIATISY